MKILPPKRVNSPIAYLWAHVNYMTQVFLTIMNISNLRPGEELELGEG